MEFKPGELLREEIRAVIINSSDTGEGDELFFSVQEDNSVDELTQRLLPPVLSMKQGQILELHMNGGMSAGTLIRTCDVLGKVNAEVSIFTSRRKIQLDTDELLPGLYLLEVIQGDECFQLFRLVIRKD